MLKAIIVSIVAGAMLTACAQPMGRVDPQTSYRQQGLISANTSEGACDDVGQFTHVNPALNGVTLSPGQFTLEADAEPKP